MVLELMQVLPTWYVVVVAADEVKQSVYILPSKYSNIEAQMCGIMRHKRCQPRLLQVSSRSPKDGSYYKRIPKSSAITFCCESLKDACDRKLASLISCQQDALELLECALEENSPILVASCLKVFLRELPDSLKESQVCGVREKHGDNVSLAALLDFSVD
ncbi:hypothetical protein FXO38_19920 [Capsicum annuum]|uniref:Rho-GAP domain-containing protein n=1 Tax=Capsicum annuum TaxID=4072 RepID=A0A2G2XTV5_CAPAN|nr:hypothetical protein FXO38_19920 [Capsicum annuum]PHT60954.1 hypothetical protein T459_35195 [Capsicum annuum]